MKLLDLDTALLVASLVQEPCTELAHQFHRRAAEQTWLISPWEETELATALALPCRRCVLSAAERDQAWQRFQVLRGRRLQVLELSSCGVEGAARLCISPSASHSDASW